METLGCWVLKPYAKQPRNASPASPHPSPVPDPHPRTCPPCHFLPFSLHLWSGSQASSDLLAHPPATMSSLLYYWKETFTSSSWLSPFGRFFSPFIFLIIMSKNESCSTSALLKTDIRQARHFLPQAGRQPSPPCHAVPTDKTDTTQASG